MVTPQPVVPQWSWSARWAGSRSVLAPAAAVSLSGHERRARPVARAVVLVLPLSPAEPSQLDLYRLAASRAAQVAERELPPAGSAVWRLSGDCAAPAAATTRRRRTTT